MDLIYYNKQAMPCFLNTTIQVWLANYLIGILLYNGFVIECRQKFSGCFYKNNLTVWCFCHRPDHKMFMNNLPHRDRIYLQLESIVNTLCHFNCTLNFLTILSSNKVQFLVCSGLKRTLNYLPARLITNYLTVFKQRIIGENIIIYVYMLICWKNLYHKVQKQT